jgi:hypothetical protein
VLRSHRSENRAIHVRKRCDRQRIPAGGVDLNVASKKLLRYLKTRSEISGFFMFKYLFEPFLINYIRFIANSNFDIFSCCSFIHVLVIFY